MALGPGTGSFLIFALVGLMGYNFLRASAKGSRFVRIIFLVVVSALILRLAYEVFLG
ncbi:hypothetical protein [Kribbella qitaiheensis]|uniref:hypothetical protein n=1 Tax=Kribbella qitaiheensis TaxID=1544730 RepID=UPI001FE8152A|nr:hypothetical protein [Kribbella qitaiheensis]